MPAAARSIVINRRIDYVWTFVTDGSNAAAWRSGILDVFKVSGSGVGEIWKQGVRGPVVRPSGRVAVSSRRGV